MVNRKKLNYKEGMKVQLDTSYTSDDYKFLNGAIGEICCTDCASSIGIKIHNLKENEMEICGSCCGTCEKGKGVCILKSQVQILNQIKEGVIINGIKEI